MSGFQKFAQNMEYPNFNMAKTILYLPKCEYRPFAVRVSKEFDENFYKLEYFQESWITKSTAPDSYPLVLEAVIWFVPKNLSEELIAEFSLAASNAVPIEFHREEIRACGFDDYPLTDGEVLEIIHTRDENMCSDAEDWLKCTLEHYNVPELEQEEE